MGLTFLGILLKLLKLFEKKKKKIIQPPINYGAANRYFIFWPFYNVVPYEGMVGHFMDVV